MKSVLHRHVELDYGRVGSCFELPVRAHVNAIRLCVHRRMILRNHCSDQERNESERVNGQISWRPSGRIIPFKIEFPRWDAFLIKNAGKH